MSDLLSPILVLMEDEVDSFWCFCGLMEMEAENFELVQHFMQTQLANLGLLIKFFYPQFYHYLGESLAFTVKSENFVEDIFLCTFVKNIFFLMHQTTRYLSFGIVSLMKFSCSASRSRGPLRFLDFWNGCFPTIKFTQEQSFTKVNLLDTTILLHNNTLQWTSTLVSSLYVKPNNICTLSHNDSSHQKSC